MYIFNLYPKLLYIEYKVKNFAKFVYYYKNLVNFVFGDSNYRRTL